MTEDAELLMTLYDAKDYKAITENYVVHWSRDGLMSDLDQMYNLRVMFTVRKKNTANTPRFLNKIFHRI